MALLKTALKNIAAGCVATLSLATLSLAALSLATLSLAALSLAALSLAALPPSVLGQDQSALAETQVADRVDEDMVFLAGDELIIGQQTSDDLFVAASKMQVDSARADHLIVGGPDQASSASPAAA